MSEIVARHVAVIGGGIVGACVALSLLQDGHRVTLVEPGEPGGQQAASYGNGAFLSPASIIPMSVPGIWRKVPGYLLDPLGPLTIRWRSLPALAPWLLRFIRAGATSARVERTARILAGLLAEAPARHAALARAAGLDALIRQDGLLYAYPDRAAFAAEDYSWRLRRQNGITWRELDGAALHAFEPALARRYSFAALLESGGHCTDPGAYVAGLVAQAQRQGAQLRRARATGFEIVGSTLARVLTDQGPLDCDAAVIAAGIQAKALAAMAGDHVPLESERGYHVEIENPAAVPRRPVMPSDGKMANTLTSGGLRAAGQVELASAGTAPDWRRAEILLRHLLDAYPGLGTDPTQLTVKRWQGNRPSTPDGLPVIGPARATPDIIHAFGHGHVGLASAPRSAELVAALLGRHPPAIDLAPFAAARFR